MFDLIQKKWPDILYFMKSEFDIADVSYDTWLAPLRPYTLVNNDLYVIHSDDPRIVEIVTKKYRDNLSVAIKMVTHLEINPVFICESEKDHINRNDSVRTQTEQQGDKQDFNDLILQHGLNPKYTFYSFVSGKSNELAHAASLAVAENPGRDYKLLYIYGGSGLGKTHLMHAIAIYILKNNPKARILYTTSENFTNEYVESIRNNTTDRFRKKYRSLDVLLIDDIQFLVDKESTQEEFFNTFNHLYNNNRQIVISSDKPPREINNLEERIRSRFEWGLMADIQRPNFETRMAILRKKEELEGYNIDDEVIKYIATNIKSNIRTLEGALKRIVLKSKLERVPITAENAAYILKDVIGRDEEKITPEKIISVIAEHYHISEKELASAKKNKELAYPRQIAMYLCCEMTDATQKNVGDLLGGRDHATVIHGRNKIAADIQKDDKLRADIDVLRKKISP